MSRIYSIGSINETGEYGILSRFKKTSFEPLTKKELIEILTSQPWCAVFNDPHYSESQYYYCCRRRNTSGYVTVAGISIMSSKLPDGSVKGDFFLSLRFSWATAQEVMSAAIYSLLEIGEKFAMDVFEGDTRITVENAEVCITQLTDGAKNIVDILGKTES